MPTADSWIKVAGASFEILRSDQPLELRLVGRDEGRLSAEERRAWEQASRANPKVFDAPMLCVEDVAPPRIDVRRTTYSRFLADRQRAEPRVRPLAVSGYIIVDGQLLVGRRPADVTQYPGWLEAIPSGGIEQLATCDVIDPVTALLTELHEETGMTAERADVGPPVLVLDNNEHVYDLCYRIRTAATAGELVAAASARAHYTQVAMRQAEDLARADQVVPTTAAIACLLMDP